MAFFLGAVAMFAFCIFGGFLTVELGPTGLVLWLALAFIVWASFRALLRSVGGPLNAYEAERRSLSK